MKLHIAAIIAVTLFASQAAAQITGVQVKDGNVFVLMPTGPKRLTRDGHSTEAILSRDRCLIAYAHTDSVRNGSLMNSIQLCVVVEQSCRNLVLPDTAAKPKDNMTDIGTFRIKHEWPAGAHPS